MTSLEPIPQSGAREHERLPSNPQSQQRSDEPSRRRSTHHAPSAKPTAALSISVARSVAIAALTLGITADTLFRGGVGATAAFLWIVLLILNVVALADRAERRFSFESIAWLGAAVLFAGTIVWRNSDQLVALDVLAVVSCMMMAAIRLRDRRAALFAARFRDTARAALTVLADGAAGWLPVVFSEMGAAERATRARSGALPFLRAGGIALLLALVFGSLLRDADPIFASFVALPAFDIGAIVRHALIVLAFAWAAAGAVRAALAAGRERDRLPSTFGFELGVLDVTAALGTLNVLFALFVVAQLGWLFGGETFLRARTGLTAANYARQGFFQMAWVVALVVPVLVVTRGALVATHAAKRRHTQLALPLLALLATMILSAALRMKMYVHYYGLTNDRLYPLIFMGWLGVVLMWLAITVLRDRGRAFFAGTALSGLGVLAALNIADPDAIVARVNVARASVAHIREAQPSATAAADLDLQYLVRLGGGGVEIATNAVLRSEEGIAVGTAVPSRCDAAATLLSSWGPLSVARREHERPAGWRFWNSDDARAFRVVAAHAAALEDASTPACLRRARARSGGTH